MSKQLYMRSKCEVTLDSEDRNLVGPGDSYKDYCFKISKAGQLMNVILLKDGKTIKVETVISDVKPEVIKILKTADYDKLGDVEKNELRKITSPIVESMRQLVGLIKQEHSRFDISDGMIANVKNEWSLGYNKWYSTPRGGLIISGTTYGLGNMNDWRARELQELLSENEQALVATSYLHQAINARSTRYQWIYATIAAELAIKEILARIEPKLEVILETLPSPPLNKLYGVVLESVTGVKSEGLRKLQEGAERRNKLLHSLGDYDSPSYDEVHEYIHFIDGRINWLLKLWRKIKREKRVKQGFLNCGV